MARRFRLQVIVIIVVILTVAISVQTWFAIYENSITELKAVTLEAQGIAKSIAVSSAPFLLIQDFASIEKTLLMFVDFPGLIDIQIINSDGLSIGHVKRTAHQQPEIIYDFDKKRPHIPQEAMTVHKKEKMTIWFPIEQVHRIGWARLEYSLEHVNELNRKTLHRGILAACCMIFSTSILLYIFMRRPVTAIQKISAFSKTLTNTDGQQLDFRINTYEIEELIRSLNQVSLQLQNQNRALIAANMNLEEKVKQRTKELEVAKANAEEATKAKSQFLANMSHEIRTPMNAVIGFTDLLSAESLSEVQRDYVTTIRDSGQALLSIINDILDVSKIETGNLTLEKINFDFDYLCESVLKMMRSKMTGRPMDLLYTIGDDVPRNFMGDPTRIRQIIINLVGNALKFTEKGEIVISVTLDDSNIQEGSLRTIRVSVRDTGIGVPEEKRKEIFESFAQADSSTTRRYGGSGLGLAITKAFVQMMNGKIWVESEVGKGSEFIFLLQLEEGITPQECEIQPIKISELNGKSVVIIDDNHLSCTILSFYCKDVGMKIVKAITSSYEALAWFSTTKEETPDLVLSDIMMPEMDGYMLVRKIRELPLKKYVKIIAVTSDAVPGQANDLKMHGFDAYLAKPVIRGELIRVISATLGDKREQGQIMTRHLAQEICLKGMKILVVEDNLVNLKLMIITIKKYGCIVESVVNGKEAIRKVKHNQFDIVLMDMQMPEMGGIEATRIIREEMNNTVPIVALTAAAMKKDREEALSCGMNDFLTKPVNVGQLKKVLMKVISQ